MENTILTQKTTCLAAGTFGRCSASNVNHPIRHLRFNSKIKHNIFSVPEKKNLALRFQNDATRKMNMTVHAEIIPGGPVDPAMDKKINKISSGRKIRIVSTIFTLAVSFISGGKWGPLLRLKEKVETTIDEAQRVVDIIEDVAEGVDKVAEEAVKHLPEGKLRDAVQFVEQVAEQIDNHAELAEDALEKVENMEKEFGSIIESTSHQDNTVGIATSTEARTEVEKNTVAEVEKTKTLTT
ncbi:hypothetical protein CR513_43612, partial [Mucuna pruriens]